MSLSGSLATGPSSPALQEVTIGQILRDAAAAVPDRVALIEGVPDASARRQWTYAEFDLQADRVARALLSRYSPGDRIAVWAQNIPEWEFLEFGVARAGMVLVTINPGSQASELRYVLNQSRSAALFCVDSFRGNPMLATAAEVQPDCPELRDVVRFAEWDEFLASGDSFDADLPDVAPMDAVMIQYTSGTTGFPKGAYLHHRGLVNNGAHTFGRMGVGDGDVYVSTMPLFHTAGSAVAVLGAVSHCCTQVLVEAFEPGLVLALSEEYRGQALLGVPTMLIAMLEHPTFATTDLSSLHAVCSGGALVPEQLVRTFERELGAPFTIVFGQTECSPVATMTAPDDTMDDKSNTIGAPMPHVEVKIVDPESGETVAIGEVGELCTRGYHVMHNYFEMPERTAEAIDTDGWLHTGDLAAMNDRGYCTIEGRLKDMIIRGGENIYPKELEELLFAHPSVGSVAVVGLPDDKWGETVAAFLRPAPGATIDKAVLFAYMREHLAPHKTPSRWFAVEEYPMTGSGKIQKFQLREDWQKGRLVEL
jgi:fatty-acyl-CoA synthase